MLIGLVSLYWVKQYRRLLSFPIQQTTSNDTSSNQTGIFQSSDTNKGLGFIKDNWRSLHNLNADDICIGSLLIGEEARAVTGTLSDSAATIRDMPVKHLLNKDKQSQIFEVRKQTVRKADSLLIDKQYLESFGDFILDDSFWQSLKVFGSWIEPLIVKQWISKMQSFDSNKSRNITLEQYHQALQWIDAKHDTKYARSRADEMITRGVPLVSVWSGKAIKHKYHIDHCIPFAHWPNNDLWNLLPTSDTENLNKKDKVPSQFILKQSKERVLDWWDQAWGVGTTKQSFMVQSVMALPGLNADTSSFNDVFDAMSIQVSGIKGKLLVPEWSPTFTN